MGTLRLYRASALSRTICDGHIHWTIHMTLKTWQNAQNVGFCNIHHNYISLFFKFPPRIDPCSFSVICDSKFDTFLAICIKTVSRPALLPLQEQHLITCCQGRIVHANVLLWLYVFLILSVILSTICDSKVVIFLAIFKTYITLHITGMYIMYTWLIRDQC